MLPQKRLQHEPKSCSTRAGRSKRQYRSEARQRFTSGLGVAGGMKSLEWGSCAGEKIPQLRELIPHWNGDGVNTGLKPKDQARRNDHENHNSRNRNRNCNRCPWSCDHCCSRSQGRWCLLEQQWWRRCRHQSWHHLRSPRLLQLRTELLQRSRCCCRSQWCLCSLLLRSWWMRPLLIHRSIANQAISPRQHWRGFLLKETALISLDNPPAN